MSKLAKQITTTMLRDRARVVAPFNIKMMLEPPTAAIQDSHHVKVRFMAQFGVEYFIDEDAANRTEVIATTLERVRRSVIEEVFGEFRQHIRSLEHALYQRDYALALTKLHELDKEMFSV